MCEFLINTKIDIKICLLTVSSKKMKIFFQQTMKNFFPPQQYKKDSKISSKSLIITHNNNAMIIAICVYMLYKFRHHKLCKKYKQKITTRIFFCRGEKNCWRRKTFFTLWSVKFYLAIT